MMAKNAGMVVHPSLGAIPVIPLPEPMDTQGKHLSYARP